MIVGFFLKKNVIILGGKQISVQYLPHEKYIKLTRYKRKNLFQTDNKDVVMSRNKENMRKS